MCLCNMLLGKRRFNTWYAILNTLKPKTHSKHIAYRPIHEQHHTVKITLKQLKHHSNKKTIHVSKNDAPV